MFEPATVEHWLIRPIRQRSARIRLFCFPFAGGGASFYHSWATSFDDSVEVCAVQLPGHESRLREEPFTRLEPLVEAAVDALESELQGCFGFYGHSMGGLIAFEVARELRRRGLPQPSLLYVSSRNAPRMPNQHPPLYQLSESEFLDGIRDYYEPSEEAWEIPELRELLVPILRADMTICDSYFYRPEAPLEIPIRAFRGLVDGGSSNARMRAWDEETTADFSFQVFPGAHFFIHEARPRIQQIIEEDLQTLRNDPGADEGAAEGL